MLIWPRRAILGNSCRNRAEDGDVEDVDEEFDDVDRVFTEELGQGLNQGAVVVIQVFTNEQRCQQKFSRLGRGVKLNERLILIFKPSGEDEDVVVVVEGDWR